MKSLTAFLVTLGLSATASANVRVAFLEFYSADGRLIQLEPGGRFAHVAVSYQGGWLHAHPRRGVEVIDQEELGRLGKIGAIVNLPQLKEIPTEAARKFIGRPYDPDFTWADDKIYCSELVAKLFGLRPEPMHFDRKLWPEHYWKFEGLPGLSPDKVYRDLTRHSNP